MNDSKKEAAYYDPCPDPDRYLKKAKQAVLYANQISARHRIMLASDLYVVWFSKTLENWKALVGTVQVHGLYYEVTHDGAKKRTYVDRYRRDSTVVIPDEDLGVITFNRPPKNNATTPHI